MDVQAILAQHIRHEGWALLLADRWQLGPVANEQQPAVTAIIDEADEVVEQLSAGKKRLAKGRAVGYHRGLVDDEQGVVGAVVVQVEVALKRLLAIDATMDGVGRVFRIEREHLGSTPRGSHEHQLLLQRQQSLHHSGSQRGLSCTGRASQHHDSLFVAVGHECCKDVDGLFLFRCRHMAKNLADSIFQLVGNHI